MVLKQCEGSQLVCISVPLKSIVLLQLCLFCGCLCQMHGKGLKLATHLCAFKPVHDHPTTTLIYYSKMAIKEGVLFQIMNFKVFSCCVLFTFLTALFGWTFFRAETAFSPLKSLHFYGSTCNISTSHTANSHCMRFL